MQMGQNGAVVTCKVTECSYNQGECCTAPSIQVGDQHPQCDTFTTSGASGMSGQEMSQVGGCRVTECHFNENMDCGAPGITVTHHTNHADCSSYRSR